MRRLTLCSSESSLDAEGDTTTDRSTGDRSPRSPRTLSESDYVSLADLPRSVGARSPRSMAARLSLLVGTSDIDRSADRLVPLSLAGHSRLRRIQDVLLVVLVGLCGLLAGWACTQVYTGTLCVEPKIEPPSVPANWTAVGTARECAVLSASKRFEPRGGPDIAMADRSFTGGWPFSHSLLHVFVPTGVALCVIAMRLHSSVVHDALVWVWFALVQLSIIIIDVIAVRRWQGPACEQLQAAIAASLDASLPREPGRCETLEYEAFVAVEMVLVLVLALLALLEPVVFRLWCGVGQADLEGQGEEPTTKITMMTLQREDLPSPHATYRRL